MKPYGYVRKDGEGLFIYGEHQFENAMGAELVPVYLHPKEWVELTDEDYFAVLEKLQNLYHRPPIAIFAKAIEQTLKERNHD